nr:MAG TPA: hypothetical protein [Caudoviricetes sp.]
MFPSSSNSLRTPVVCPYITIHPLLAGVYPLFWGHIIYNNPHKYTVLARIALV